MTTDFLMHVFKQGDVQKNIKKRQRESAAAQSRHTKIKMNERLTGGRLFLINKVALDDDVLALREEKEAKIINELCESIKTAKTKYEVHLKKYQQLEVSGAFAKPSINAADLLTWLTVRKRKANDKIPTKKTDREALKLQWETQNRAPLSLVEYLVDQGKDAALVDKVVALAEAGIVDESLPNEPSTMEEMMEIGQAEIV